MATRSKRDRAQPALPFDGEPKNLRGARFMYMEQEIKDGRVVNTIVVPAIVVEPYFDVPRAWWVQAPIPNRSSWIAMYENLILSCIEARPGWPDADPPQPAFPPGDEVVSKSFYCSVCRQMKHGFRMDKCGCTVAAARQHGKEAQP